MDETKSQDPTASCGPLGGAEFDAAKEMSKLVYWELRRLATTYMRGQRPSHTLQVTGLVNEAMTRVLSVDRPAVFRDDHHFYATAARVMRQVLVDHARARNAAKRGEGRVENGLVPDDVVLVTDGGIDLVEMDDALARLQRLNAQAVEALELHYFAGLTLPDTARIMKISESTVTRQIRFAKAWLVKELHARGAGADRSVPAQ